jgi:CHAD domain-containing protein
MSAATASPVTRAKVDVPLAYDMRADAAAVAVLRRQRLRPDLDPLRPVLLHSRMTARAEMTRALRSARAAQLFEDWDRLLETLVELPVDDRPLAQTPIGQTAGMRIRTVYKRIVHMGSRIESSSPPEAYHELRKKAKELRYLLELLAVKLFDPEHVARMVKSLKALQDVLGRHQDREVQSAMLQSIADEVATLSGGGRACLAMGVLTDRLAVDEAAAREEFGERFAAFASHEQRALVRHTFI